MPMKDLVGDNTRERRKASTDRHASSREGHPHDGATDPMAMTGQVPSNVASRDRLTIVSRG